MSELESKNIESVLLSRNIEFKKLDEETFLLLINDRKPDIYAKNKKGIKNERDNGSIPSS